MTGGINSLKNKKKNTSLQRRVDFGWLWPGVAWAEHTHRHTHTHTHIHTHTRLHSMASLSFFSSQLHLPLHFFPWPSSPGWMETRQRAHWNLGLELCRSELWIIVPQYECLWLIAWDKVLLSSPLLPSVLTPHHHHLSPPPPPPPPPPPHPSLPSSSSSSSSQACLSSHNQPRTTERERNYLTDPVILEHDDGCPNYSTITKALI